MNNDGNDKVGFTAPSFHGQAAAIQSAQATAGISADSIGYVEAHGTGTILGDPIELAALTEVFRAQTEQRGFCGIGSVKSNFGHLSCAAGVAGLIKTILALEHGAIPPTLHFTAPNPAIDFAGSPFYVTTSLRQWERNGTPRRAGVSSFGVGGTNAHVVIEEAPVRTAPAEHRPHQLLVLSARSQPALDTTTKRLAEHLQAHQELDLADVAFTLHTGRRAFQYRRVLVGDSNDREAVVAALSEPERLATIVSSTSRPVVYMFPGQGSQYPGMAAGLYQSEPIVRQAIDYCARHLKHYLGIDLRRVLFPSQKRQKGAAETLRDTRFAQPMLFTVEYALSELWKSWGILPAAMIGHSVGEYVAATLAGVMSLDDALMLIACRGQLISDLPRGSMLAVMAPAERLERFVDKEVSLAAINAPGFSVLSGPNQAIDRVEAALIQESTAARRLHTSHAFHSAMMEPILGEFENLVRSVQLFAPKIPFVSTLNGEWANGPVMQPDYWSAQLRSTVRFADGLHALMKQDGHIGKDPIFLEVGPGKTLVTFAAQTAKDNDLSPLCLTSLPNPDEQRSDTEMMLSGLGQLWANGIEVDWAGFHCTESRIRVSLPTYPFERRSYWVGELAEHAAAETPKSRDTSTWFHRPAWRTAPPIKEAINSLEKHRILIFDEGTGLGAAVSDRLRASGGMSVVVRQGNAFERIGEGEYLLNPSRPEEYQHLAAQVCAAEESLAGVIDCWSASAPGQTDIDSAAAVTLLNPMRLAHALSSRTTVRPLPVLLVARGTSRVHDEDVLDSARALGIGPAKVVPQEHPGLRLAHIDVDASSGVPDLLLAELAAGAPEPGVALRYGRRYIEAYEPLVIHSVDAPRGLPERSVVMITGGLGHMGINLAEALFERMNARLVLIGRSPLPDPEQWVTLSEDPATAPELRNILKRLAKMRAQRDELLVLAADLNDNAQVAAVVDAAVPNLRAFLAQVRRVLVPGGWFLYTDLLPVQRWMEVRALLGPLGLTIADDRHITPNVLASCDEVAATRVQAFDEKSALIDNFLAVPGSAVYEQMRSGGWEYRILRSQRA